MKVEESERILVKVARSLNDIFGPR
jgi:hypothetical protein